MIQQPKVIQLTSGPGYSFYSYAYSMPQNDLAVKVIQLMSGPGYSFYSYAYSMPQNDLAAKSYPADEWSWIQLLFLCLFNAPKIIQQPIVIQLTSGPGYSFYSYAYSMPQNDLAAKSYPADEWSWIQLLFLCLFNAPK